MIDAHLQKLRARDTVSPEDERIIRSLVSEVIEIPADKTAIRHGIELQNSMLLLDGWMARAKDLPTGERQVAELHVAGDFVDLHSFTLKSLDHDVITMTNCRLAIVPHERLKSATERSPHLTRLYWLMTNIDAAIQREWSLSLGRRSALGRMAHLFCELNVRLGVIGLSSDNAYDFPLTQVELGECLGLTSVHVNRTLQELRRLGLIALENRRLTIFNLVALKRVAGFDPAYLYLGRRVD
ncbi:MAG: Crp/Fnr family transcriptional regulator [Sphingomonas sp.]|nr:Crp/Fnr family transcriptional regulator [Sphingomonas sp.]